MQSEPVERKKREETDLSSDRATILEDSGRPTIRDVARLAGVSIATVSHVVNKTGRMSSETENRVRRAIETLKYTANAHARELACWRQQVKHGAFTERLR